MHLSSLIHFVGSCLSAASTILCFLLYLKNRRRLSLELTLFLASLTLMAGGIAVQHYGLVASINTENVVLVVSGALGANLFIMVVPALVHHLFGQPLRGVILFTFISLDLFVLATTLVYTIIVRAGILLLLLQASLYLVLVYGLIYGMLMIRDAGAREIRQFLGALLVTALVFFPLLALDTFLGTSPLLPYNLSLPLFLLALSVESCLFAFRFLDRPAFLKDNRLTRYCIETLKLSPREREIVESLLKGHTNRQISEELFISLKTVENHLSSIYHKAGVKSRTQLVNLIHTNAST